MLIFTGNDQGVEEVQCGCLDPHHGLAGTGDWLRQIGEFKFVGGAELAAENGFHAELISGFGHSGINEAAAQAGEGKPQAGFHRAERQLHALRDRRMRQAVDRRRA